MRDAVRVYQKYILLINMILLLDNKKRFKG